MLKAAIVTRVISSCDLRLCVEKMSYQGSLMTMGLRYMPHAQDAGEGGLNAPAFAHHHLLLATIRVIKVALAIS